MVHNPQAASLRRRLATASHHGAGRPYPEMLRRDVCQQVVQGMTDGLPLVDLATTIVRCCRDGPERGGTLLLVLDPVQGNELHAFAPSCSNGALKLRGLDVCMVGNDDL